ncbi:ATP-binding protein [Derxia gummosa]|uniref:ATP-binding protein n=1 Tax=Derxia gummosa DSM 723 TaxID=1121388 RepID=A0A8B6XBP1_9BURK|nr:YhaN family protein [Derxia gummosa]
MKLRSLHLLAFGPFTRRTLDFGPRGTGVHLVTGANEAGKSSALRAMGDLRFGIHAQSRDDFVHDYKSMRIAGVFDGSDGKPLALLRRKGNKATLQLADPVTLEALPDLAVPPEVERALGAGLTRTEFEQLFGLDHARLRAGGRQLLAGEAEVGAALFDASAGSVSGVRKLIEALDADAKRHFNPHGRAETATINAALKAWDAARKAVREATVKPAEWSRLDAAARAAEVRRQAAAEDSGRAREEQTAAELLKLLIPQLAEFDACERALADLIDAPRLAPEATARRMAAEAGLAAAEATMRQAASDLAEAEALRATLDPDANVLAHAEPIERLAAAAARASAYRLDLRRFAGNADDAAQRLALAATRIAPGLATDVVVAALPSDRDARALQDHAADALRLTERLGEAGAGAEQLHERIAALAPIVLPDLVALDALGAALANLLDRQQASTRAAPRRDALACHRAELAALLRELTATDTALTATDSDPLAMLTALALARPLPRARLAELRDSRAARDAERRALLDRITKLDTDLAALRIEEASLLATGQPVTEASRNAARAERDRLWLELRQQHLLPGRAPDADALRLADRYFMLMVEADRQADALHADATRATRLATCLLRIRQIEAARADLARDQAAHDDADRIARADWQAARAAAHLPDLDFDALAEWQTGVARALTLGADIAREQAALDMLDADARSAGENLASLLGHPPQTDTARLAAEARQRLQAAEDLARQHERREAELAGLRQQLERLEGQIAADTDRLDRHRAHLSGWYTRLLLPADATPADIAPRLDELARVVALDQKHRDAKLTLRERQVELDQLAQEVEQLARRLDARPPHRPAPPADGSTSPDDVPAPPGASIDRAADQDPVDRANGFARRLAVARDTVGRAATLDEQIGQARRARDRALADADAARATLAVLCAAAGCSDPADLPALEDRAARRRDAEAALARARADLDRSAPGLTPDAVRERIAGLDLAALDTKLQALAAATEHAEAEHVRAIQAARDATHALQAIDASDRAAREREAMEHEAARVRDAVRPWLRLKLAHGLLSRAMDSFRERAQAPMVAAASAYFSIMTGGKYVRLVVDEIDERPALVAETAGGTRIPPDAMSEGTADQLYLALRLAALDLRTEQDMPLVLDDVLMTSDDGRAARILDALSRFARRRQVLVFSHHDHLAAIARGLAPADGAAPISLLRLD